MGEPLCIWSLLFVFGTAPAVFSAWTRPAAFNKKNDCKEKDPIADQLHELELAT